MEAPRFPQFLPIHLEHRERIQKIFWDYQPSTFRTHFYQFFLRQGHYGLSWSMYEDWLILLAETPQGTPCSSRRRSVWREVCRLLLNWLRDSKGAIDPFIDRADSRLAQEIAALANLK